MSTLTEKKESPPDQPKNGTSVVPIAPRPEEEASQRFVKAVEQKFVAAVGMSINWTDDQKRLAQHLFLHLDKAFAELEKKRQGNSNKQNDPAISWQNVNLVKLALDSVNTVSLGLDALIPNHVHAVPYLNGRTKQYDVDLRIGYTGMAFYRPRVALLPPKFVRIELVHATDKFTVVKSDMDHVGDTYKLEITEPFNRGDVVGGFGYIIREDPSQNEIVLVGPREFDLAKKASKTNEFWSRNENEMKFKTVVIKTMKRLQIDPMKVNGASAGIIETEGEVDDIDALAADAANSKKLDLHALDKAEPADAEVIETAANEETKSADPKPCDVDPETGQMLPPYLR